MPIRKARRASITSGRPARSIRRSPDQQDRDLFHQVYRVTPQGNFEGQNILQRNASLPEIAGQIGLPEIDLIGRLEAIHQQLAAFREKRVRPLTDDKVLVSWNALALRAFAEAARYLQRPDYLELAQKNAAFLLRELYPAGRLLRAWRDGQARHNAYLEDHAGMILALLDLYQSDANPHWYAAAGQIAGDMLTHFRSPQGSFYDTRADQDQLITRPSEVQDNATPSGSALAASALLHLAAYDERADWRSLAEEMLAAMQDMTVQHPTAFGFWLQGLDFALGPVRQIAVVGPLAASDTQALLEEIWRTYRARTVVAAAESPAVAEGTAAAEGSTVDDTPALLRDRGLIQNAPTAYVCQGFVCSLPVNTVEGLKQQLG